MQFNKLRNARCSWKLKPMDTYVEYQIIHRLTTHPLVSPQRSVIDQRH